MCMNIQVKAALPTGAALFGVNVPMLYGGPTIGLTAINYSSSQTHTGYVLTFQPLNFDPLIPRNDIGKIYGVVPAQAWALWPRAPLSSRLSAVRARCSAAAGYRPNWSASWSPSTRIQPAPAAHHAAARRGSIRSSA